MFQKLKNHIQNHQKSYSLGFVFTLFLVAGVLLGQSATFNGMTDDLTGYVGRYRSVSRMPVRITQPVIATQLPAPSTLPVNVSPVKDVYNPGETVQLSWTDSRLANAMPSVKQPSGYVIGNTSKSLDNPLPKTITTPTIQPTYSVSLVSNSGLKTNLTSTKTTSYNWNISTQIAGDKYKIEVKSSENKTWTSKNYLKIEAPITTGTLMVTSNFEYANYQIKDSNNTQVGRGEKGMPNEHLLPSGDYQVIFGWASSEQNAPETQSVTVVAGETVSVEGVYERVVPTTGTLIVTSNFEYANYQIKDSNNTQVGRGEKGMPNEHLLPSGDYQVIFGWASSEQNAPETQSVTVVAGETVSVEGVYEPVVAPIVLSLSPPASVMPMSTTNAELFKFGIKPGSYQTKINRFSFDVEMVGAAMELYDFRLFRNSSPVSADIVKEGNKITVSFIGGPEMIDENGPTVYYTLKCNIKGAIMHDTVATSLAGIESDPLLLIDTTSMDSWKLEK